jgi:hypothetical protein
MQHAPVNTNEVTLNLSGYYQDRRRGSVGGANACRGILQAGARDNESSSNAATSSRVPIRHIACRLLMASGDKTDVWLIVEAIQQVIQLYTRQAKYDAYTFAVERLCKCLTTGHLRHIFSPWRDCVGAGRLRPALYEETTERLHGLWVSPSHLRIPRAAGYRFLAEASMQENGVTWCTCGLQK